MKKNPILFCFSIFCFALMAQPGVNGAYTVTTTNQVLNKYSPLKTDIAAGSNSLAFIPGPSFSLCPGDLVMVYQAQGASINSANNVTYGNITNYSSAGLYEFKYVQSVNANTLTLQSAFTNSYSAIGRTQIIKVPQFSVLTINSGASVIAKAWKDTTISGMPFRFGGIVAIHASTIINNGLITASGNGFRGGAVFYSSGLNLGQTDFTSSLSNRGGEKGESIAGYQTDYDNNNGRYCMGAAANGGGGGNGHNAGGGGGANGFNGNTWTGQGVMIVNSNNLLAAWSLSSGYLANGNALTNSSGGGHGGYSYGDANANATIQGPGNNAWVGDLRREVGGVGGRPLTNIDAETRIYFGGGGGAPHGDNSASGSGANGGGIVYLIATTGISGTGTISSNGNSSNNTSGCNCDGVAGAGAGGSIVIKTNALASTQAVSAIGGTGGNQMFPIAPSNPNESEGPGGGGGGGFVAISSSAITPDVSGGLNGTTLSNAVAGELTSNGATQGGSGQTGTVSSSFINFIGQPVSSATGCIGSTVNLFSPNTGSSYQWYGPGGYTSNSNPAIIPNFNSASVGIYSVTTIVPGGCNVLSTVSVTALSPPTLSVQNKSICKGATVILDVTGASTYSWSNSSTSSTIQVSPPATTIYTVWGFATNGCSNTATLQVLVKDCTGITENQNQPGVLIYPNPSRGIIIIESEKELELNLFNEAAQLVKVIHLNPANGFKTKISGLAKGVYFLTSVSGNLNFNQKLIVAD